MQELKKEFILNFIEDNRWIYCGRFENYADRYDICGIDWCPFGIFNCDCPYDT